MQDVPLMLTLKKKIAGNEIGEQGLDGQSTLDHAIVWDEAEWNGAAADEALWQFTLETDEGTDDSTAEGASTEDVSGTADSTESTVAGTEETVDEPVTEAEAPSQPDGGAPVAEPLETTGEAAIDPDLSTAGPRPDMVADLVAKGVVSLVIDGAESSDDIQGSVAREAIFGSAGDDSLDGGGGEDYIFGGDGNDTLYGGSDTVNDYLYGGAGDDTIVGSLFYFDGESYGADLVDGGDGNDSYRHHSGLNEFIGGAGYDTLVVMGEWNAYTITRGDSGTYYIAGTRDGMPDEVSLIGVEAISFHDQFTFELDVDDATFDPNSPNNQFALMRFDDSLVATPISFSDEAGEEGGSQTDGGSSEPGSESDGGDYSSDPIQHATNHTMLGTAGDDTLDGVSYFIGFDLNGGMLEISGGDGNDLMLGGEVWTTGLGDAGDDTFKAVINSGGLTEISFIGGVGYDTLDLSNFSSAPSIKRAGVEDYYLYGDGFIGVVSQVERVLLADGIEIQLENSPVTTGTAANDDLYADHAGSVLSGFAGNDRLRDGNGNDSLDGGDGDDEITSYSGYDIVSGGAGNDAIYALANFAVVDGGDGDDDINIVGGTVSGGAGADTFHIHIQPWLAQQATITDFEKGVDRIILHGAPEDVGMAEMRWYVPDTGVMLNGYELIVKNTNPHDLGMNELLTG